MRKGGAYEERKGVLDGERSWRMGGAYEDGRGLCGGEGPVS